ncbi:hypothetical protein [Fulvivirga ligni]|uniref:hypothetical protein n=1 Tax=Fulvivirga ligni TaxID=2904246 RepID=UPI001F22E7E8|nr:hypothetical protein [Fulvivirga ligni]UII19689.1 hypothetical protein LVD16_17755 [Fulvivirga ligni]
MTFEKKYFPITCEVGFLEADFDSVISMFKEWQEKICKSDQITFIVEELKSQFPNSLERLLPLTSLEGRRFVFIQTNSKWVAFFENGYPYPEIDSVVGYLASKLKCRTIRAGWSENQFKKSENIGSLGATIFTLYTPEVIDVDNCKRSIQLINEGSSWRFYEYGEKLSFEKSVNYRKKKKEDRFNRQILASYLSSFGLDFFDENFYSGKLILIQKVGGELPSSKIYNLSEAQASLEFTPNWS